MSNQNSRIPAVLTYLLPVIGWLYVYFFQRKNKLAYFHLRQAIGLFGFLIGSLLAWAVVAWLLTAVPSITEHALRPAVTGSDVGTQIADLIANLGQFMAAVGVSMFGLVIAAWMFGVVTWFMGMNYAIKGELNPLPFFGRRASRLLPN